MTPLALTESQRSGIPAQVYLGIAINETGWGGSTLARDQHNYFSIKGQGPQGSATYNAWEVVNGQNTTQNSAFRAYKDPQQSFSDFTDFLHSNPRYQPALDYIRVHPNDWRAFVHMLNDEGYATDPNWADKVISLGSQFSDDAGYPSSSVTHSVDQQGGVGSVLSVGSQAIGQRYQFGGAGGRGQSALTSPTDCSGFVSWAYEQGTGIRLPAQTSAMYASTLSISPNDAQPGDLVFYNHGQGEHLEHVGIYAGNGAMLHDSSINPDGGVDITPLWGGAEFRRVPGVDPSLRQPAPSLWGGQGSAAAPKDWVVMVKNGRQYFYGTNPGSGPIVQDMGPAPEGKSNGDVIDGSFNYPVGGGNEMGAGAGEDDMGNRIVPYEDQALNQATTQATDPFKRQYPVIGPGGDLGIVDPRLAPPHSDAPGPLEIGDIDIDLGGTSRSMHPEDPGAYPGGGGGYSGGLGQGPPGTATAYPDAATLGPSGPTVSPAFDYAHAQGDKVVAKADDIFGDPIYVVQNTHSSGDTQYLFVNKAGQVEWKYFDNGSGPPSDAEADTLYSQAFQQWQTYGPHTQASPNPTSVPGSSFTHGTTPGSPQYPASTGTTSFAIGDQYVAQPNDSMVHHFPDPQGGDIGIIETLDPGTGQPAYLWVDDNDQVKIVTQQPPTGPNAATAYYNQVYPSTAPTTAASAASNAPPWKMPAGIPPQAIGDTLRDYGRGVIDLNELHSRIGDVDPASIMNEAQNMAAQGDRSLLDALPLGWIRQSQRLMDGTPGFDQRVQDFQQGKPTIQMRNYYPGSVLGYDGNGTYNSHVVGDGDASNGHGEVHVAGAYSDTQAKTAGIRYNGRNATHYAELRTVKPGAVTRDMILDLVNDPNHNAQQIMDEAAAWARNQPGAGTDGNKLTAQYLVSKGYKAIYGGGFDGPSEAGEIVWIDPDIDSYTDRIDAGRSRDMVARFSKMTEFSPDNLAGAFFTVGFGGAAAAAAATQTQGPTVQPAQQPVGTGHVGGSGMSGGGGAGTEEAPRPTMSKKEASYTKRATEDYCGDCSMFRANKCTLVKGTIHQKGSCDYFEPKKAAVGAGAEGGMGAGDQWYDDPLINQPDDSATTDAASTRQVLATPGMGYQVPTNADVINAQAQAQYTADQANIQNEAQFLGKKQGPPRPADPVVASSDDANAAVGRFDLRQPPSDTRHAIDPSVSQPLSNFPRSGIGQTPAPPVPQPIVVPQGALPSPVKPPEPSLVDRINANPALQTLPGAVKGVQDTTAQVAQNVNEFQQTHTGAQVATDVAHGAVAAVQGLAQDLEPAVQVANAVAPYLDPTRAAITMAPGVDAVVQHMVQNGIDVDTPMSKALQVDPNSMIAHVAQKAARGQQINPLEAAQFGVEWMGKMNDFRADVVRAQQPAGIRGTPEGEAAAQGLALITDPLNVVGLPEINLGRKLLTEGAVELAPKAAAAVEHLTFMDEASLVARRALARPYGARETIDALQHAGLALNDEALIQDSRAIQGLGRQNLKYEPLSGEQIRRAVLKGVARSDPKNAAGWAAKADRILESAGLEDLTSTSLMNAPQNPVLRQFASHWGNTPEEIQALAQDAIEHAKAPPRSLETFNDRQAARASVGFAAKAGLGGGLGMLAADRAIDPNDPYRNQEIAGAGLIGALALVGGAHMVGGIARFFDTRARALLAPTSLLTDEARALFRTWAGSYAYASLAGQHLENEMRAVFGNLPDYQWQGLADYIETHNAIPPRWARDPDAQAFLRKWQKVTTWAVKHDIIPNEINFVRPGSKAKQYVPHARKDEIERVMQVGSEAQARRPGRMAINPMDYYNKPRTFETLSEGRKAMGQDFYEPYLPRVWGNYLTSGAKRKANQELVDGLIDLAQKTNPALVSPSGLQAAVLRDSDIFSLPLGMTARDVPAAARKIDFIPNLANQNIYASDRLYGVMHNLFRDTSVWNERGLKDVADMGGMFKHNVLSGSAFHLTNEIRQLMATQGWNGPKAMVKMFSDATLPGTWARWQNEPQNAALIRDAVQAGVNLNLTADRPGMDVKTRAATMLINSLGGAMAGYGAAAAQGKSEDERWHDALTLGLIGGASAIPIPAQLTPFLGSESRSLLEHFSNAMWSRWIPHMKLSTYAMYAPKFGKEAAADFVNSVYGGQNLLAIARSPTVQDWLKVAMLAPDWQEGWARQLGYAAFDWRGPQGAMNRRYWASAGLQSAMWLEGANLVFGGHWSWENDPDATMMVDMSRAYDAMGIKHTDPTTGNPYKPYADILGPYRGIFEVFQQIGRWGTAAAMQQAGMAPIPEVAGEFGRIPEPLPPQTVLGNYLKTRVGILPATAWEVATDKDWLGRPINRPTDTGAQLAVNRVNQLFTHFLPTGESELSAAGVRGDPMPLAVGSALTGMRIKHESNTNQYFAFQDQFSRDLGQTTDDWNKRRATARARNDQINQSIEAIQSGTGQWADQSHSAREQAIVDQARGRQTLAMDLQAEINEAHLSPEDRLKYDRQLQWLKQQSITYSGQGSADLDFKQRTDLNPDEMFRLAWNRDPAQIATLKGQNPRPASLAQGVWEEAQSAMAHRPGSSQDADLAALRARWTQEVADQWGVDPAVMEDFVKAHLYQLPNTTPPVLTRSDGTSMTSEDLDTLVTQYQSAGEDLVPTLRSQAKQQVLFDYAAQTGVDPQNLAQRVKLRTLPMVDNTDAGIERSRALDLQTSTREVPYVKPDGTPLGGPADWKKLDAALKAADDPQHHRGGKYWTGPDLLQPNTTLNDIQDAKNRATVQRFQDIQKAPPDQRDAWEKWFGEGAQMTDAQFEQFKNGTLDMWTDSPTPDEAQKRNAAMVAQRSLTAQQRFALDEAQNQGRSPRISATITNLASGQKQQVKMNLGEYLAYISHHKSKKWETVGVDPLATPGVP